MPTNEEMRSEAERLGLGATGDYPHGQLSPDDQGELRAAITVTNGKIVLNFGKPVAWLSMTKEQAIALAKLLVDKAT